MDTIFFEPSYEVVKSTLLKPIEMIVQTLQSMPGLERDLVPLVDIKPSVAVVVSMEDPIFLQAARKIEKYIQEGYEEPKEVLENFKQYSYLFEKSQSMMIKKMFGENKDKPIITTLDKEEIERNIFDFLRARHEIERLCIDEIRFTFFQVRTKLAKEALVQKASEVLTLITTKTAEIVTDNIARITKSY